MASASESTYGLVIGGREIPASRGEARRVLDPATNRPIAEVAAGGRDDARHALEVADAAFRGSGWASDDGARRSKALTRLARLLEEAQDRFALLETRNMGKTLRESKVDIGYVVRTLEYVAGLADKIQGETIPVPGSRFDYTLREPLGVTVHIAPWNYPLLLAIRSVAPALAAGNAVVLKPATLTPLTAVAFARLASAAGVPDGILNVVTGNGSEVGDALIDDPRCASVSFTGSLEVGRRIAEVAARRLVPATLELGGKSPVVVFPDADLERAARAVAFGIFGNAGQMCWAASRLIVHESVRRPLLDRLKQIAEATKLAPGADEGAEMGPVVSAEQAERILEYVAIARTDGGTVVTGGARATAPGLADGNFVLPTVVDGLPSSSRAVREEIFGPVLSVSGFSEPDDAVRQANDTRFGLFAALWTRDLATAHSVARRLEAGMVAINESPITFPQTPFGGYKESGLGFEQGVRSVEPYTRRKNVVINVGLPKKKA
ncbi:MAG TPA: aldehyde dehydrogenase family protein [Thermoplasmata archaeon]|nr:aldehyde dehydrogenase family protein [Thermoplasmata archaeon]